MKPLLMNILSDLKVIDKRYHPGILGPKVKRFFSCRRNVFLVFVSNTSYLGSGIQLSEGSLPEFCEVPWPQYFLILIFSCDSIHG